MGIVQDKQVNQSLGLGRSTALLTLSFDTRMPRDFELDFGFLFTFLKTLAGTALSSVSYLLIIITTLSLIYLIGLCAYNALWHPLARYPGPWLGKFTKYRYLSFVFTGNFHLDTWRSHEKYGPFVRVAPNAILCNTAQSFHAIYRSPQCIKPSGYAVMNMKAPSTFSEVDPAKHERRRRILSFAFSDAALRSYEPRMLDIIAKFIAQVTTPQVGVHGWTGAQDMGHLAGYLSLDMITSIVYGKSYNLLGDTEYRGVVTAMDKLNKRIGALVIEPMLASLRVDRLFFRKSIKNRNVFVAFVLKVLEETMSAKDTKGNAFSVLMHAKDPETGQAFDQKQLASESSNLIMAGSDTVATALAATMFYLCRYKDEYEAAAQEVRANFSCLQDVRPGPILNKCRYLKACISEAMRLSPSVGSNLWRTVVGGPLLVDGQLIPEGCLVGTGIYSLHHSEEYFEDPFVFKPGRWIRTRVDVEDANASQTNEQWKSAFNPFSTGTRGCIGKGLAMNELMLTMAALFVSCDFRTPVCEEARKGEGSPTAKDGRNRIFEYQMPHYLMATRVGPMVEFRARKQNTHVPSRPTFERNMSTDSLESD